MYNKLFYFLYVTGWKSKEKMTYAAQCLAILYKYSQIAIGYPVQVRVKSSGYMRSSIGNNYFKVYPLIGYHGWIEYPNQKIKSLSFAFLSN